MVLTFRHVPPRVPSSIYLLDNVASEGPSLLRITVLDDTFLAPPSVVIVRLGSRTAS